MQSVSASEDINNQQAALVAHIEQIKCSIVTMRDLANSAENSTQIALLAQTEIELLEYYQLALRLQLGVEQTESQTIAASGIFYDVIKRVEDLAGLYGVDVDMDVVGAPRPVLADVRLFSGALVSILTVLVRAASQHNSGRAQLTLGLHATARGKVAVGVFGSVPPVEARDLRQAKALRAHSFAPMQQLVAGPVSGLFIADALLHHMGMRLRSGRHRKQPGLAATFTPSPQLSLV